MASRALSDFINQNEPPEIIKTDLLFELIKKYNDKFKDDKDKTTELIISDVLDLIMEGYDLRKIFRYNHLTEQVFRDYLDDLEISAKLEAHKTKTKNKKC